MSIRIRRIIMAALISAIAGCGQQTATTAPAEKKSEPSVPEAARFDLPRMDGITVDGRDGDWGEKGLQLNVLSCDTLSPLPARDFDALARLGWTDEGLLVLVEVRDNEFREEPGLPELYKADSVELFLNTAPQFKGSFQAIVSPGLDPKFPELRFYMYDNRPATQIGTTELPFEARRTRTAEGYCLEALIPWSNVGVKPEIGTKVAFRLSVNDLDNQGSRRQMAWADRGNPWHILRLAEKPSPPVEIAAWAVYDRLLTVRVNVVATADRAGRTVEVSSFSDGKPLKSGIASDGLRADGRLAVASLEFPAPAFGEQAFDELAVSVDRKVADRLHMPDIHKVRMDAVRAAVAGRGRRMSDAAWKQISFAWPTFKTHVLENDKLPAFEFGDPEMVRRLVGPFTVATAFYDADFNKVSSADKSGRLGAVSRITIPGGDPITVNRTLYRLASNQVLSGTEETEAILLASGQPDKYLAELANDKWWHELQRKLGTAARYEYAVFLPKDYEADAQKRWPLVVFLHGSGMNRERSYEARGRVLAEMRNDVIVVAPSSGGPGWRWPAINDLLDELEEKYRVDPDRLYLTGFSMGGYGTWSAALAMPQRFAAIAPVGGGPGRPEQAARVARLPIWVFNGDRDTATTLEQARKMVDAVRAANGDVKLTVIKNADHMESLRQAYTMPELYEWLLKHARPGAPQSAPPPRPD